MRKTYTKRILGSLVLLCGLFSPYSFFHHENKNLESTSEEVAMTHSANSKMTIVYAATTGGIAANPTKQTDLQIASTLEAFLKVVYVLLWPLLWIAGWAMDNSLVYGEIFGLDQALFKFWQIMKNFANFALGFLFVRSIVKYILNPSEKKHPKDMISKLLVAGVGVQLSWFIMGALVDLSSVLTIGVGGLPLNLLDQADIGNKPVFGVVTKVKLNDAIGTNDGSVVLFKRPGSKLTEGNKFLLPCLFTDSKIDWSDNWKKAFGVLDNSGNVINNGNITGTNYSWQDINAEYCIASNNIINKDIYTDPPATYKLKNGETITPTRKSPIFSDGSDDVRNIVLMSRERATSISCDSNNLCQTMGTFTKRAGGFQGAFYSLYTSLLNLSTIHVGVPKGNTSLVMETLIKTIVGLAYLIPLAILCVVLIMRVGYLWLIIAFSPFIILAEVKDLGISGLKDGVKVFGKDKPAFNAKNVISLLLLPVVVTFAVSLSIVFLSSLSEGLSTNGSQEALGIYSRTEGNYKCYDIVLTDICLDMPKNNIGTGIFDYFSWLIMNLFGVGMMWFIVMAALKSSELTKGVAESVETLGGSILQNAPIIPIGGGTSFKSMKDLPGQLETDIRGAQATESQALSKFIQGKKPGDTTKPGATNTTATATEAVPAVKYSPPAQITNASNAVSSAISATTPLTQSDITNIATAGGISGGSYNNSSSLFNSKEGQKMFGNILAQKESKVQTTDELKKLYMKNAPTDPTERTKYEAAWTGIAKDIEAEKKAIVDANVAGTPTPGQQGFVGPIQPPTPITLKDKTYTIKDNKLQVTSKDANNKVQTREVIIPEANSNNEYKKEDFQTFVDNLNELKEENYTKFGKKWTGPNGTVGKENKYKVKDANGAVTSKVIIEKDEAGKFVLKIEPAPTP